MNAALLDMLSARAAAGGNPMMTEMIARMRGGEEGGAQPDMQELIAQLAQDNPMLGILAQQMADRRNVVAEVAPAPSDEDGNEANLLDDEQSMVAASASLVAQSAAENAQLQARLESVTHELCALRDREDILAEALGACCLCWGEDNQCRACRGRGKPGFSIPDEEAFAELVLPAVRMLRACRVKQGVIAPMTPTSNLAPGASSGALRQT